MADPESTSCCPQCGIGRVMPDGAGEDARMCPVCGVEMPAPGQAVVKQDADLPPMPPSELATFPKLIHQDAGALHPLPPDGPDPGAGQDAPADREAPWFLQPWIWGMAAVCVGVAIVVIDAMPQPRDIGNAGETGKARELVAPSLTPEEAADPDPPDFLVAQPEVPEVEAPKPPLTSVSDAPEPDGLVEKDPGPDLHPLVVEPPEVPPAAAEPRVTARLPTPVDGRLGAEESLRRFLQAGTLEERLPVMTSRLSIEELGRTGLAGPLPAVKRVEPSHRENHPRTGRVDSYFLVTLADSMPVMMLVRQDDGSLPKVVADPFLDLHGGRLLAFASPPGRGSAEFEVVVSAVAGCGDGSVPDPGGKMTLQLLAQPYGEVVSRAYFRKGSSIARMLEDGTFRLSYGNPTACRVLVRWNRHEGPRPYLEALEVKGFGWGAE